MRIRRALAGAAVAAAPAGGLAASPAATGTSWAGDAQVAPAAPAAADTTAITGYIYSGNASWDQPAA
ncbi:hypothetical protein ACWD4G_42245 [Streptomyces sp. NPDC002643]